MHTFSIIPSLDITANKSCDQHDRTPYPDLLFLVWLCYICCLLYTCIYYIIYSAVIYGFAADEYKTKNLKQ